MTEVRRPHAVAFDVVDTLFSLDEVEQALTREGVESAPLERFLGRLLRDGFALSASGTYRPFSEVANAALAAVAPNIDAAGRERILQSFSTMSPHPDARPAMEKLAGAGLPIATLTNGSAQVTAKLLAQSGLDVFVARVISIDEVQTWKPAHAPYQHAAAILGVETGRLAMVAVHAWDVHGANRAGLITGWASRREGTFAATFDAPDVGGADLVEVADGLLALADA